jgi:hypothetical protein
MAATAAVRVGLVLLIASGAGEVLAGLAPEDVGPALHVAASIVGILALNVGAFLLGIAVWTRQRWVSVGALVAAVLGLLGFFGAQAVGLPPGTSERLAGYPGVVWLIAAGGIMLWSVFPRSSPGVRASARA